MATEYTFSIQNDFPNHKVATDRLIGEIRQSSIITALDYLSTVGDVCSIWFKASLSAGDQTLLNGIVAAHNGEALPDPLTDDGKPIVALDSHQANKAALVAMAPLEGKESVYTSHNFCDPTTWYTESTRVTEEVLTDNGDGQTWNSTHTNWIDMYSGKVQDEDGLILEEAERVPGHHGWAVVVTVDGVTKTMREPLESSGGDYTVDYVNGKVVFFSSQAGKEVKATYSYAVGSGWRLTPAPNRILQIQDAEAQFSVNVDMNDAIVFQVTAPIAVVAPQLMQSNGGPLPDDTRVPVTGTTYKRFAQMVDEARGAYPIIPPIGGTRGTSNAIYGFPFQYSASRDLKASLGLELWVRTKHDRVFGGERATATFYCLSLIDPNV